VEYSTCCPERLLTVQAFVSEALNGTLGKKARKAQRRRQKQLRGRLSHA
jgi:hypothetical protein